MAKDDPIPVKEDPLIQQMRDALALGGEPGKSKWNNAISRWRATHQDNEYIPLSGVLAKDADLTGYNFRQVTLTGAVFDHCHFANNYIERSELCSSRFVDCDMTNVTITRCQMEQTTFKGTFQDLTIKESVFAEGRLEGNFVRNPANPESANRIVDNYLITCTEIVRTLKPGEAPTLDLENGPLQVQRNQVPELEEPPKRKDATRDRGIHNSHVTSVDVQQNGTPHSLKPPALKNTVIEPKKDAPACDARLGDPHDFMDYSAPKTAKAERQENHEIRRNQHIETGAANLNASLFEFGGSAGKNGLSLYFGVPVPLNHDAAEMEHPHMFTAQFSGRQQKFGGMEVRHFGGGPGYSFSTGQPYQPRVNYKASVALGAGSISFKDDQNIGGNYSQNFEPTEFTRHFAVVTPTVQARTWMGNIGVSGGAQWPLAFGGKPEMGEGHQRLTDNSLSSNTYKVTATDMKLGPNVYAAVEWNIYPLISDGTAGKGVVSVFARGNLFFNNNISYDAEVNNGQGPPVVTHGLKNTGMKPTLEFGIYLGR